MAVDSRIRLCGTRSSRRAACVTFALLSACATVNQTAEVTTRLGSQLRVEVAGFKLPAVVVVGDGPGICGKLYAKQLAQLTDEAQLITYQYRSCADAQARYTRNDDLQDLAELLRSLNVKRPILLGHGYGATLAMQFALAHPERISGLILVAPYMTGATLEKNSGRTLQHLLPAERTEYARLAKSCTYGCEGFELERLFALVALGEISERSYGPRLTADAALQPPLYLLRDIEMRGFDVEKEIANVELPTLVIGGKHDLLVGNDPVRLGAKLPHAITVMFEQSGHWPIVEENPRFVDVVLSWLRDLRLDASAKRRGR